MVYSCGKLGYVYDLQLQLYMTSSFLYLSFSTLHSSFYGGMMLSSLLQNKPPSGKRPPFVLSALLPTNALELNTSMGGGGSIEDLQF